MSAGDEVTMPIVSWQTLVALLGAGGLGGAITALIQRPARRSVDAAAAKDQATGEAAVIAATAEAFTEVTGSLRDEIERLKQVAVRFEADLQAAHDRAVVLEAKAAQLSEDLARVRGERDAALGREQILIEKLEMANGQIRQLQQVLASTGRTEIAS